MEKNEMKNLDCEDVGILDAEAKVATTIENAAETTPIVEVICTDETAMCKEDTKEVVNQEEATKTEESVEMEDHSSTSCHFMRDISSLASKLDSIEVSSSKSASSMHELHKLYHTEFAGRLKKMQSELEDYQEIEKGRVYDGILTEIAKIYSDNEDLVDELGNKRLKFMFMDLLQILESNGVQKQKSEPGDKRNTKHCQVIEQLDADSPDLNDTVVKSLNTGFYVENRTFVKERVHVQTYRG